MYAVLLTSAATRDLDALDGPIRAAALRAISALGRDPRPPKCTKLVGTSSDWRIRFRGDYRVLYEVSDLTRTVTVLRIRHRREAYR